MNKIVLNSLMAAAVLGGVIAFNLSWPAAHQQTYACLAIGEGVCFSGTTEWVALSAEIVPPRQGLMIAMAGSPI